MTRVSLSTLYCVSICLCLYLFVSLPVCVSLCLRLCLFVTLSVCVSVCLCLCLFVSMSVCVSLCLCHCLFVSLSVCVAVCLCLCLFVSLSLLLCLFMSLSFWFHFKGLSYSKGEKNTITNVVLWAAACDSLSADRALLNSLTRIPQESGPHKQGSVRNRTKHVQTYCM